LLRPPGVRKNPARAACQAHPHGPRRGGRRDGGDLAARGFEGPEVILEGKFGVLDVYARDGDASLIAASLGEHWETLTITFKTFPCHVTSQSPVQALLALRAQHRFTPADVAQITIDVSDKVLSTTPTRRARRGHAQYSLRSPSLWLCFATPGDPQAFLDGPNQKPGDPRTRQARRAAASTTRKARTTRHGMLAAQSRCKTGVH